ncbi:MAG: hypothetical protein QOJ99_1945 [Bryobacterales bacterium]|nr:hypothetical protein [Bryobacterales bacterium]
MRVLTLLLGLEALLIFVHIRDYYRDSIARAGLAFLSFFVIAGYPRVRVQIQSIRAATAIAPFSGRYLALHFCSMLVFLIAAEPRLINGISGLLFIFLIAVWCLAGVSATIFAGIAFMPAPVWLVLIRITWNLWLYALIAAGAVWALAPNLWNVWDKSGWTFGMDLTFWLVRHLLRPFLPGMTADLPTHVIGSDKFKVEIGGACSGWEGIGLVVIFTAVWLWLSRREYKFPVAFILIPGSVILIFGLNAVRIAALILIGHAGAQRVAISGFHSQAGWIAFNLVALGISVVTPRIGWLRAEQQASPSQETQTERNPAVAFLLPFAVILAAGMISRATADQFEWLYALRFFAAAPVLWYYRSEYGIQNWIPDWFAVLAGISVFLLWLALDYGPHPDNGIAGGLAALPLSGRIAWISFRTLAAITTVPLAEELAFRGFLLRRIISAEFETVDFRRVWYPALIGSSVVFGLMHGGRWIAGTLAGLMYAGAMLRRGRITDGVIAHAITNALLAIWVLTRGSWYLW